MDSTLTETTANASKNTRSKATDRKAEVIKDYMEIIPDDEIDEVFLMVLHYMQAKEYRLLDTPQALLDKVNQLCE